MTSRSRSHLVLIPSFNTGQKVLDTVKQVRQYWDPVWVVVDGSTDGSAEALMHMAHDDDGLRIFILPRNEGKGAAILHGLRQAVGAGFTHVLTMDADGQHPAASVPQFMRASQQEPDAMILGKPVFDDSAPQIRVRGRRVSNWWTNLETLWWGIGDSLFGLRVYPAKALLAIMSSRRSMRRFDFDAEAAVRLAWRGVPARNIDAPVRYFAPSEGGVSHFRYVRDNAVLALMHARLVAGLLPRLPRVLRQRRSRRG